MAQSEHVAAHATDVFTPSTIQWSAGPASLPPGPKMAILEGDPAKPGLFLFRLRFPDGFQVQPHWHPTTEHVTVLSGVFKLGHGDTFDESAMEAIPAGSYVVMPPNTNHFVQISGETVVQYHSIGPWAVNYVKAADDPRNAAGQ
ncbi:MAG: cupin domain-containing protein [Actinomycetota bacterium]